MEIERKFKLVDFPDLPEESFIEQWQGYLAVDPEVRIRREVNHTQGWERYILCIKSIGDLIRHEVETPLEQAQYEELASMLNYPLIHKELHAYRLSDGYLLECSKVDGGAFSYAEVEFPTEEEANAWQPLDCLGQEMTYESGFRMRTYWSDRSLAEKVK